MNKFIDRWAPLIVGIHLTINDFSKSKLSGDLNSSTCQSSLFQEQRKKKIRPVLVIGAVGNENFLNRRIYWKSSTCWMATITWFENLQHVGCISQFPSNVRPTNQSDQQVFECITCDNRRFSLISVAPHRFFNDRKFGDDFSVGPRNKNLQGSC